MGILAAGSAHARPPRKIPPFSTHSAGGRGGPQIFPTTIFENNPLSPNKYMIVWGVGVVPNYFCLESFNYCSLGARAKFCNPTTIFEFTPLVPTNMS